MVQRRFDPKKLGAVGEDRAASWYVEHGYRVLERNWRCAEGEIDLIVDSGEGVVFAEVKTRTTDRFGTPFEAVDHRKQRKLRQLASIWLSTNSVGRPRSVRFDVVAVVGPRVEVRPGAF